MQDLVLKINMSLDGFVGRQDGGLDWIFPALDATASAWLVESVWDVSLHIMGSRTFRDMSAYWPTSTLPTAAPMNLIPKAVFTQHPEALPALTNTQALADARAHDGEPAGELQAGAESWAKAYVASGELTAEIAKLTAAPGKRIAAYGGSSFVRSLVRHGLVDQYELLVHPIAVGQGQAIFSELSAALPLKLVSSTPFASGAIAQIYRPA